MLSGLGLMGFVISDYASIGLAPVEPSQGYRLSQKPGRLNRVSATEMLTPIVVVSNGRVLITGVRNERGNSEQV